MVEPPCVAVIFSSTRTTEDTDGYGAMAERTRSIGYLPWTWNRWNGYSANLITPWDGTATSPWGTDMRQRMTAVRTARTG